MIIFRCTARVRRRFGFPNADPTTAPTARLGDWYANLLNVGTGRWVLCLSELSLLPVLIPARNSEFPHRFPEYLEAVLAGIGAPSDVTARETSLCSEWHVGKTRDRSLLGSMNDFSFNFETALGRGLSAEEAAIDLSGMPCGPLEWRFPREAALTLLGGD